MLTLRTATVVLTVALLSSFMPLDVSAGNHKANG